MMGLLDRYTDFLLIVNSMYKVRRILEIYVRELPRYVRSSASGRLLLQKIEDTQN